MLSFPDPSDAEAADSTWLTAPYAEVNETAAAAGSTLIVPVGSVEQHGHHLPAGTDTLLVDAVAHCGVARVEDDVPVLLTPPVWTGFSPHHEDFGGTISPPFDLLREYLFEVGTAALQYGFDAVLFVNGHGGNGPLLGSVVSTLGAAAPDAEVLGVTYFDLAAPFVDEVRESDTGGMGHGGEFETSLMQYLYPDLVREDAFESVYREEPYAHAGREMFDGGPLSVYRPFSTYSETGHLGDPTLATAAKGELLYDGLGDELADVLTQIHAEVA
jgi:creatinine amidohydrolase